MREMYESACHPEPSPPTSSLAMIGGDPFYDRNPWFRLIGRYICTHTPCTTEDVFLGGGRGGTNSTLRTFYPLAVGGQLVPPTILL